jgi:Zn-dependent protease with chaperone function
MHYAIYVALVAALVLPSLAAWTARHLPPPRAAVLLCGAAFTAGAVWVGGLALLSLATLSRWQPLTDGHWSPRLLRVHNPVPVFAGWVSLLVLALVVVVLAMASRDLVRGLRRVRRLRSRTDAIRCDDLAVLDDNAPGALALPGRRGSIVVTSGMLRALRPAERDVMLAHERSHLRWSHWAFRLMVRAGAALSPAARVLVGPCDQALERWADEDAARSVGDRQIAAAAVARAALAIADHAGPILTPAFSDGMVSDRVAALLAPPPRPRWVPTVLPLALAVLALLTLAHAVGDLDELLDLARSAGIS